MKRSFFCWGMGSQARAVSLQALWCLLLLAAVPWTTLGNAEADALLALRQALIDPSQVLQSWDPSLVNPCTWFHVTCDLNNLVIRIDLGDAELSGTLVPQLGLLTHLEYLEMFNNSIGGAIPSSLGNLTQLVSLDLYNNEFTGEIPPQLGNLSQLTYLRLNNNSLTGAIPESLTGLDNLQVLDLSYNDLSGCIPVTGVFANFTYKSFEGNPDLEYPDSYFSPAPTPEPWV
ncbi:unnamed protein product [Calypogeia fissa]